jgi:chemotaxis family two-component system response regulator Rcp1
MTHNPQFSFHNSVLNAGKPIDILLVEDNPAESRLIEEVLKDGRVRNNLSVVVDGVEAMAFLRKDGKYANAPYPDLILLDLNLPRKSGREVLVEIKEDPYLKQIPVVILTTSADEKDILESYRNHVNCYITKPVDLEQFITVVRSIEGFWLTIVKLPPEA